MNEEMVNFFRYDMFFVLETVLYKFDCCIVLSISCKIAIQNYVMLLGICLVQRSDGGTFRDLLVTVCR